MKLKLLLPALFLLIIPFTKLAASENLVSFSAGILTGIPIYNSKEIVDADNSISQPNKAVFGSDFYINLNIAKEASFFFGVDFLSDLSWNKKKYSDHFHFSFPLGIKIYPNLGGFNLGLSYVPGFRYDFIKTTAKDTGVEINHTSAWGNGFKFSAEYDFSQKGKQKYYPSVGIAWSHMPRGDNCYDNLILFYINSNF